MIINIEDDAIVAEMMKLAILASRGVGLGEFYYNPALTREGIHVTLPLKGTVFVDYYEGRMVKFYARRVVGGGWEFPEPARIDYQSWAGRYPGYQALCDAAIASLDADVVMKAWFNLQEEEEIED